MKRAEQKASEYKVQAEEAKRELIKERAKNAHFLKQLQSFQHKEPEIRSNEMAEELKELSKCFEKSEMISLIMMLYGFSRLRKFKHW